MLFFFGCSIYDEVRKERNCSDEVIVYDTINGELTVKHPIHIP